MSLIEAGSDVLVGMCVSFAIQLTVYPLYGWHPNWHVNVELVGIFTASSFTRRYITRRIFEAIRHAKYR